MIVYSKELAHDLFLLLLNLSQFSDRKLVLRVFCQAMESMWPSLEFSYSDGELKADGKSFPLDTKFHRHGSIHIQGEIKIIGVQDNQLIGNAVQMLALLLERLSQQELLEGRKKSLEQEVAERTYEISQKNQQIEMAMEGGRFGFWDWDLESGKVSYSSIWGEILGYKSEEVIQEYDFWESRIHPEDKEVTLAVLHEDLLGRGEMFRNDHRLRAKSGEWVWVAMRGSVTEQGESGSPKRVSGIIIDISERKGTEDKLKESEYRFKTLHNASFGGIAIHEKGVILDCNQGLSDISGYTMEELIGMNGLLLIAEEAREYVMSKIVSGEERPYESVGVRKNGKVYPVRLEARNIPYKGKNVRVVEFRDISERKRAEEKLRVSERQLREVVSKAPFPMVVIHGVENIDFLNESFIDVFGYTLTDMQTVNDWWLQCYPDSEYRNQVRESWKQAATEAIETGQEIKPQIWEMRRKDGELRTVEFKMVPLGEISVVTMLDLTEQKHLVEDLTAAKEQAEAANIAKTEFLANMSHEIRTPLNGIMGMLQLVSGESLEPMQQEYTDIALQSCRRLTSLLGDILDLSKIESGKLALRKVPFSPKQVFSSIEDLFKFQAQQSGLSLSIKWYDQFPESVLGDELRLRQVLFNLVGNAIKFTEKGGVSVEGYALPGSEFVLFSVADTGIGIPDEKIEAVFNAFTQSDGSYTRSYQGAGLGLSIVKRLTALLGGSLAVDSQVDKGTTIYLSLPLPRATSVEEEKNVRGQTTKVYANVFVLVVEDEYVNRLSITRLLEKQGVKVKTAEDGREALRLLRHHDFDLIFMDIQMPELDGVEATKIIRNASDYRDKSKIPIVALTAHAMIGDKEKFIAAGMDDYIAKPVDIDEVRKVLKNVLGYELDS